MVHPILFMCKIIATALILSLFGCSGVSSSTSECPPHKDAVLAEHAVPIDPSAWLDLLHHAESAKVRAYVVETHPSGHSMHEYGQAEYRHGEFSVKIWTFQQYNAGKWRVGPDLQIETTASPAHVVELRGDIVYESILLPDGRYHKYEPYDRLEPWIEANRGLLSDEAIAQTRAQGSIELTRARQSDPCLLGTLFTPWIGPAWLTGTIRQRLEGATVVRESVEGVPYALYLAPPHVYTFDPQGLVRWITIQRIPGADASSEAGIRRERSYVWSIVPAAAPAAERKQP